MTTVYTLLVAHFVADFIAQSDWMAQNKSKDWSALSLHVLAYGTVLSSVVAVADLAIGLTSSGFWLILGWLWVNIGAHFITDAITSRINSRLWQAKQVHWFFVGIGADQLIHYVTLFATAELWLR